MSNNAEIVAIFAGAPVMVAWVEKVFHVVAAFDSLSTSPLGSFSKVPTIFEVSARIRR
ncbi:hypothetical protein [Nocardia australiensis]|uniref:hypothetical protein n=1 Tax=Nocardia australiensis TaxID=2887191 RepID=UPI001D159A4D|nr:hypothetical protein [Nocardia australiensis]